MNHRPYEERFYRGLGGILELVAGLALVASLILVSTSLISDAALTYLGGGGAIGLVMYQLGTRVGRYEGQEEAAIRAENERQRREVSTFDDEDWEE